MYYVFIIEKHEKTRNKSKKKISTRKTIKRNQVAYCKRAQVKKIQVKSCKDLPEGIGARNFDLAFLWQE